MKNYKIRKMTPVDRANTHKPQTIPAGCWLRLHAEYECEYERYIYRLDESSTCVDEVFTGRNEYSLKMTRFTDGKNSGKLLLNLFSFQFEIVMDQEELALYSLMTLGEE